MPAVRIAWPAAWTSDGRIAPHIAAGTAPRTKPEIVDVLRRSMLQHQNQLVLRTVEGPLASGRFCPHTEVLHDKTGLGRRAHQLRHVAPVHADMKNRAIARHRGAERQGAAQKVSE